jgi:hypothetical protein
LSYSIPQVNVSPDGHLIPNPSENVVSTYRLVDYDKFEGDFNVTDVRIVWIGSKHKGGLLGKIAKAAVVVGAAAVAASAASKAGRQFGVPPGAAGLGAGAVVGLGMASLMTRHQDGSPTTISIPYEVFTDAQIGKDKEEVLISTQVGVFKFKFEKKEEAQTVVTVIKAQRLNAQRRPPTPAPPQYQPPPQYPPQYQAPPAPAYGYPQPPRSGGNYCPHCGSPLEPGARFCQNCGARVD